MQGRSLSSVSLFSSASLPLDGGSQHLGSEQSARPRGQPVDGTVTATARAAALADFFDDVLSRSDSVAHEFVTRSRTSLLPTAAPLRRRRHQVERSASVKSAASQQPRGQRRPTADN
ncbi:MAG: hypothetical protein MHM6MM_009256 [Cercozoa sp. M6MM]